MGLEQTGGVGGGKGRDGSRKLILGVQILTNTKHEVKKTENGLFASLAVC